MLTGIDSGDFIKVAGVDFAAESPDLFAAALRLKKDNTADGVIQVRVDSPDGELLASLSVDDLAAEQKFERREAQLLTTVRGIHDLYLIFDGEGYEIKSWQFVKK